MHNDILKPPNYPCITSADTFCERVRLIQFTRKNKQTKADGQRKTKWK